MDKQKAIEKANYFLRQGGMKGELVEMTREGIAIIIPGVSLEDIGYNNLGKQNPISEKEGA